MNGYRRKKWESKVKMTRKQDRQVEMSLPDRAMPYAKVFFSLKYFPTIATAGV